MDTDGNHSPKSHRRHFRTLDQSHQLVGEKLDQIKD
jgi:hypothetical protein